jgi:hypothetical protein
MTPYPVWNRAANTEYGVLWDLSLKTIRKFAFMLDKNFKQELDNRIVNYLKGITKADLPEHADFLFFLEQFWSPYAPKGHQQIFLAIYDQDSIRQDSDSYQWIQKNREKIDSHLTQLQEPLDVKKFFENIIFALKTDLTLKYSAIGPVEE